MKKYFLLVPVFILVLSSCGGPTQKQALAYDDAISWQFEMFGNVYAEYAVKKQNAKPQEKEDYRAYTCNQVLYFLDTANKTGKFDDDGTYIRALINYLTVVQKTMQERDGPMIQLMLKDSLMTKEDSAEAKFLSKQTLMLTDDAYLKFLSVQKKFREKNKITEFTK